MIIWVCFVCTSPCSRHINRLRCVLLQLSVDEQTVLRLILTVIHCKLGSFTSCWKSNFGTATTAGYGSFVFRYLAGPKIVFVAFSTRMSTSGIKPCIQHWNCGMIIFNVDAVFVQGCCCCWWPRRSVMNAGPARSVADWGPWRWKTKNFLIFSVLFAFSTMTRPIRRVGFWCERGAREPRAARLPVIRDCHLVAHKLVFEKLYDSNGEKSTESLVIALA